MDIRVTQVGEQLRAARETQGLSLGDVAERTRIPSRHLAAIESGDHAGLPAATYSSGFVKSYARVLGLDGQTLSEAFRNELSVRVPRSVYQEVYQPADPARTPSQAVAWISLAIALIAVLGYLYWRGTTVEDPVKIAAAATDRPPPAAVPAPVATAPAPPPVAALATGAVMLTAQSPVWLRISDPDGRKLFEGMLDTGKAFTIPADAADPRLLTGRPNALKVTVGTTEIPPLGPPEQRIRDVSLKADALLARVAGSDARAPEPASANPAPLAPGAPTSVGNDGAAN